MGITVNTDVDIDIDDYIDEIKEEYDLVERGLIESNLINEIIEVLERRSDYNFIREIQFKQKTESKLKLVDLVKE